MSFEKIKTLIKQNKVVRTIVVCMGIVSIVYYLMLFFTPGAKFNDTFLTRHVKQGVTTYTGQDYYGKYRITVTPISTGDKKINSVRFELPSQIDQTYEVSFTPLAYEDIYIDYIKDENNQLIEAPSPNEFYVEVGYVDPFPKGYTVPYYLITDFATMQSDALRGNPIFLIMGIVLLVGAIIEIVNPLFFFKLKHLFDVVDPQPSDFYLFTQKITTVIGICASIIILIMALFI